jgi:hypothetical protein
MSEKREQTAGAAPVADLARPESELEAAQAAEAGGGVIAVEQIAFGGGGGAGRMSVPEAPELQLGVKSIMKW